MYILRSNLMVAIQLAIRSADYADSAFVQGLKEVLAALQRGEHVEIVE